MDAALAELAAARDRVYHDAEADRAAADAYYRGVAPEGFAELLRRTHVRMPGYRPSRELYPWVDLQPTGVLRSLYTGHEWDPEELIRADLAVAEARTRELAARSGGPGARADAGAEAALAAEVEAALPFNCEHVVPQSWFARREPMRGDLHHLFACEARCNSFRGNTPFEEFADFPPPATAGPAPRVVRGECGKSEGEGFEPTHGKGAAARAVLYFLLRYPGEVQPGEMPPERREVLVRWHEADPVTDWERHRNAAIAERQGNRNPLVDRPELAGELCGLLGEGAPRAGHR
ncbi:endonuclease I family protein [Geodermatophilus bullaregiensis]|uniref:endonuclease I family protein n=1 Tax=Geodermatophilus bullaregiensis TaxID=1564160 RepID=UPI00195EB64F|nr:endonuclease [Geodermatophilus bullaregiensis]